MTTEMEQQPKGNMDPVKELINAALQAMTPEMVTDMVVKAVKSMEIADEVIQPETLSLLRKLPEVSESLERTLTDVKRLEENGTLKSLLLMGEMASSMKNAMTGLMISESVEKVVQGAELADSFIQKGVIELADGMVSAFDYAIQQRSKAEKPMTLMQMARMMTDSDVREGLSLLLTFLKAMPGELKK